MMNNRPTCNMIASTHCGCEITTDNLGTQSVAHFNMGNKPHQWRTLYQCKACRQKDLDIQAGCGDQKDWMRRRIESGLSAGQMARLMNLGTAVYSRLEHCRDIAPESVRADFERVLAGPSEEIGR